MLKTIGSFNKSAPNKNNNSRPASSKNNSNKLVSRRNNNNSKVQFDGGDGKNREYAKK